MRLEHKLSVAVVLHREQLWADKTTGKLIKKMLVSATTTIMTLRGL